MAHAALAPLLAVAADSPRWLTIPLYLVIVALVAAVVWRFVRR